MKRALNRLTTFIIYYFFSTNGNSCPSKTWILWVHMCAKLNNFLENLFSKWTVICAKYPVVVIVLSVLIFGSFMTGFLRFKEQTQSERLYFPQESTSKKLLDRSEHSFNAKTKPEEFLIEMKNGSNILNEEAVKTTLKIHEGLFKAAKGFSSICILLNPSIKPTNQDCAFIGILDIFQYNESLITDRNINSNESLLKKALNDNRTLFRNGRPASVNLRQVLGSYKFDKAKNKIEAKVIRMIYYAHFQEFDEGYEKTLLVEKRMIDYFESQQSYVASKGMVLHFFTGRSTDDSIAESSGGDLSLVIGAIVLMCSFTTLVLIKFNDMVAGHFVIGKLLFISFFSCSISLTCSEE